jgi:hypothetical protein
LYLKKEEDIMKRIIFITLIILVFGISDVSANEEELTVKVYLDLDPAMGEIIDKEGNCIKEFQTTIPKEEIQLPQRAIITWVQYDPPWVIPPGIKARNPKKYKDIDEIPAGDENNYMGMVKWHTEPWPGDGYFPTDPYVRVHEEIRPERIGTKDSVKCIRLLLTGLIPSSEIIDKAKHKVLILTTTKIEKTRLKN